MKQVKVIDRWDFSAVKKCENPTGDSYWEGDKPDKPSPSYP